MENILKIVAIAIIVEKWNLHLCDNIPISLQANTYWAWYISRPSKSYLGLQIPSVQKQMLEDLFKLKWYASKIENGEYENIPFT